MRTKRRILEIVDEDNNASSLSLYFNVFIVVLILLNVVAIVLGSFKGLRESYKTEFYYFEIFSVAIFTAEYLARLWTSDLKYPKKNRVQSLAAFVFSPIALVDLFAILPTYLPLLFPIDLRFIRILRFMRITRLLKLHRYSRSLKIIGDVLRENKADLGVTFFITFILLTVASTFMYYIEGRVQPEAFPNIVASFWWAIATLTTVGYGDVYPVTDWGKVISGIIALLGIGIVALPTGILSAGFMDKIKQRRKLKAGKERCSLCGQLIVTNHPNHTTHGNAKSD
jgi:voltage-gated potassium channel